MWVAMSVVGSFFGVGVNFSPNDRRLVSSVVSFSSENFVNLNLRDNQSYVSIIQRIKVDKKYNCKSM